MSSSRLRDRYGPTDRPATGVAALSIGGAQLIRSRRIHVIGGPGSGKSTLARELGASLGIDVFELDRIAFEGVHFAVRPLEQRLAEIHAIVARPEWITEGVHLGWTDELLHDAEVIVWLDYLTWWRGAIRILRRFGVHAVAEAQAQPGHRKFAVARGLFAEPSSALRGPRRPPGTITGSRRYPNGTRPLARLQQTLRQHSGKVLRVATGAEARHLLAERGSRLRGWTEPPGGSRRRTLMRLLLVTEPYPPFIGGAHIQTQLLAEQLGERGHIVSVATVWQRGIRDDARNGIEVHRLRQLRTAVPALVARSVQQHQPPFPDPITTLQLRRLIRAFRPDPDPLPRLGQLLLRGRSDGERRTAADFRARLRLRVPEADAPSSGSRGLQRPGRREVHPLCRCLLRGCQGYGRDDRRPPQPAARAEEGRARSTASAPTCAT